MMPAATASFDRTLLIFICLVGISALPYVSGAAHDEDDGKVGARADGTHPRRQSLELLHSGALLRSEKHGDDGAKLARRERQVTNEAVTNFDREKKKREKSLEFRKSSAYRAEQSRLRSIREGPRRWAKTEASRIALEQEQDNWQAKDPKRRKKRRAIAPYVPPGLPRKPGLLKIRHCHPDGSWPPLKKFDLVISWWTGKPQSHMKHSSNLLQAASFLEMGAGQSSRIDNQAEIKYSLRSYEKFGLLDHVNHVFLLIDDAILSRHGAPRFFDYSNKKLTVMTDKDLGLGLCNGTTCGKSSQWSKLLRIHTIPGLSDYFLWVPDDIFLMQKFDLASLWDVKRKVPYLRSFGTWSPGWCARDQPVGTLHGPVLMQKCAMEAVLNSFLGTGENQTKAIATSVTENHPIDAFCLFTRNMVGIWHYLGLHSFSIPHTYRGDGDPAILFHSECHTNDRRHSCKNTSNSLFLNIQGDGISDEYGSNMSEHAKLIFPEGAHRYFESHFPEKSRFEV